ncbi:MAG: hypothetical protein M3362_16760 [Acidobacteriota bacterium]|nr:hypothetical protein [Acidobacteriota bacterium]
MTYLFNLWNFFQHSDNICEFDITRANMPRMKDGTSEWVKDCLSAFGLDVDVSTWEVKPFRSHYFSDYWDSTNWQDRWTAGWNIRVVTKDKMPSFVNRLSTLPEHISTSDTTWEYGFVDPRHDSTALLISDYKGQLIRVEQLEQQVLAEAGAGDKLIGKHQVSIRSFGESMHQLRIFFYESIFPDSVDVLENLVELCRRNGSATNWRESSR